MHRPARIPERAAWSWLGALLVLLVCCAVVPAWAQQPDAAVTALQVERSEEGLQLNATVRFELPHVVEDALDKGIPMYFVAEAAIYRDRWYWYDKRIASATRHMRLSYHPLTRRWRLQVSSAPIGQAGVVLGQVFDTREEALAAIQRISGWHIADPGQIDPAAAHSIAFSFRLDVSQLPRPFQIGAVGQSEWNIVAAHRQRLHVEPAR